MSSSAQDNNEKILRPVSCSEIIFLNEYPTQYRCFRNIWVIFQKYIYSLSHFFHTNSIKVDLFIKEYVLKL